MNDDHISGLERLAKLKADGALSDSEYQKQKARLMGGAVQPPFYRRLGVVVVLTVLILTMPLALLVLATGSVFKKEDGAWTPVSNKGRAIYAGILVVWLAGAFVNAVLFPDGGVLGAIYGNKGPKPADTGVASNQSQAPAPAPAQTTPGAEQQSQVAPAPQQQVAQADGPPSCDDPNLRQMVVDGMQVGFDKFGIPFNPDMKQILMTLVERDDDQAKKFLRLLTNPTDGKFQPGEVRICQAADTKWADFGATAVIKHDGEVGGFILNTGLRTPVAFGHNFDQ